MERSTDKSGKPSGVTPPYISFSTFKTFLADLKEHGVPERMDRSVWKDRFAGNVGPYLVGALRFLKLLKADDGTKDELKALANAHGTDQWPKQLHAVIKSGYAPIVTVNLKTVTAQMLNEKFRATYDVKDDVLRKCLTFFIHAAKEANIDLSSRIVNRTRAVGTRKRGNGTPRAKKRGYSEKADDKTDTATKTWQAMLLDKFPSFNPAWPDEVKSKWFDGFQQLMKGEEEKK